ncbi:MAG: ubiquinol-cytochrome c reductase cytochrome c subunit [Acidimicrobiaceae bacterium]
MTAAAVRHRRRDAWLVTGFTLAVTAIAMYLLQQPASGQGDPVAHGHELFITGCSSCHRVDGGGAATSDGQVRGPSLVHAGAASAYYELSTGRMPLAGNDSQPKRKRPVYSGADLDALVAYVGSLGDGPALPTVDITNADLADGGEQFRATCAACHSASGAGGALSYGQAAPSLSQAEPLQVGAAVRSGPGQMPVFGADVLSPDQVNDIARYVQFLRAPDDRGGIPIGRTGPVPEGFVAWFFGIGALVLLVAWIGTRAPPRSEEQHG